MIKLTHVSIHDFSEKQYKTIFKAADINKLFASLEDMYSYIAKMTENVMINDKCGRNIHYIEITNKLCNKHYFPFRKKNPKGKEFRLTNTINGQK